MMAEKPSIGTILLVVDGTESGVHAARYAVRFAAIHKAKVKAIAVVNTETLKALLKSNVLVEAEMAEFDQELEASANINLNYVAQLGKDAGVAVETLLKKGAAHSVIISEARLIAPDLLVMGSFSSSMIRRDLNAHERRLILDEVKCPILLIS